MSKGLKRTRVAAGASASLGATLGFAATAEAVDFTVTSAGDGGGGGTLREAINLANSNANPGTTDRILFQSSVSGTITVSGSALPAIAQPLHIVGPGADTLTVSGNNSFRILQADDDLTVSGLTLLDGNTIGYGGAIYANGAPLTVENAVISSNTASGDGGGLESNGGPLTVRRSTIIGNESPYGGGIDVKGDFAATIVGSTISDNEAATYGAGVRVGTNVGLTIQGSTITGNRSPFGIGGGILSNGADPDPVLTSTIVANNTASSSPDLAGFDGDAFNVGFSLIENASGVGLNQTGPNLTGQDPQLGPLGSNGGPTPTHALTATSPALDKGSATGTDQRGLPRVFDFPALPNAAGGNGADIGAYELQGDRCAGRIESRPAALTGTGGADVIVGTTAGDVIKAKGGRDLVCAGRGRDKVSGGPGNDTLRGEGGRDTLRGQGGRDRLIGGPGRDLLIGGLLRDILRGGPGRDRQRQ